MKITPYIHFDGNAREALHFYKEVFGGEIERLSTYGESPMPADEGHKDKLIHARLVFDGNILMLSDVFKGQGVSTEGNIQLSVQIDDEKKLNELFYKMSEGGKIMMELQDQFWGAKFGMLQDKFRVNWMFNCEKEKEEEDTSDKTLDIIG